MTTRSVTVNEKGGSAGVPDPKQPCNCHPGKREGPRRGWRPRRFVACGLAAGLLALRVTAPSGAVPAPVPGPHPAYVLVDLGADLGAPVSYDADLFSGKIRLSINASGVVAGWVPLPNSNSHAAISDVNGTHDLGSLSDAPNLTIAAGINAAGQITGLSGDNNGNQSQAFLYGGGVLQALNTPGISYVAAHAINDTGKVVGLAIGPGQSGAFLYDGAGLHNLGSLGGTSFESSDAFGINHAGQVVGWSLTADAHQHAFLYDNTGMHDLGTLPGSRGSSGLAINDAGQIVGESWVNSDNWFHAFLYDGAGMRDLGTLGGVGSSAYGINNLGQVVGESYARQGSDPPLHAFLYSGGVLTDLNDLLPANSGWVLSEAHAINDSGQIVGLGMLNGQQHAFLLTFPPDPRLAPLAPPDLSVKMASTTELDLTWAENSDNEFGFEIQRKAEGSDWTKVAVAPARAGSFSDTGLRSYFHYTYRVRAVNGVGVSDWSNETGGDTGVHPHADISPAGPLDFGTLPDGTPSAAETLTISNGGNGPLNIASITVTGANASEFALVPTATPLQSVAPGGSGSLRLVFTPAGAGPRSATLTIAHDAPGSPSTVALTGNGIAPIVRLSPTALDFGRQPVGLSGDLSLLLRNTGVGPLQVNRLAFQGPNAGDFSLATDGVTGQTLQPGDIVLLNIRFTPTMAGSRSASLAITDNAMDSPQLVSLTGIGTAPLLTLSADALVFGVQPASTMQTLILTNGGDAPLTVDAVGLAGPDAGSFKIVSDSGEKSLAVGASRTLTIGFNPATVANRRRRPRRNAAAHLAAVSYNATLVIRVNEPHPGAPHSVTLTALGAGAPAPAAPPAAPTNLTAVVTPAQQVALTWTDNSTNATALAIWRQTAGGTFVRVGVVVPHTTHFTDAGVTPNTSYTYEVRAINNSGASLWSNLATTVTPDVPPAAPTNLAAALTPANQVALTWLVHSGNETALAIWRQTGGGAFARVGVVVPHTTNFTDASVSPSTSYTYEVRAINNSGASPWSNPVLVTLEAPPAGPTHLTATVAAGEIDLTWTRGGGNATGISIFRQTGGGAWERIGVVVPSATGYADRSVQPGTHYSYQVRAHNSHYASAWSNAVSGLTPAGP